MTGKDPICTVQGRHESETWPQRILIRGNLTGYRDVTPMVCRAVFAGLLTVIVIGLIVENLIFRTIERNTVQKWGTQS